MSTVNGIDNPSDLHIDGCMKLILAVTGLDKRSRNHKAKNAYPKIDRVWYEMLSTITGKSTEEIKDAFRRLEGRTN